MINWFPGHMAKASKEIEETKPLDLIIEIVDARAIKNTRNDELSKNINKPKIIIALKKDLSDIRITENTNIHITCINDNTFKNTILKILNSFFSEKIQKLKSKGLLMPQFYIMVIGLPNVGKSSFINKLTNFQTKVNVQNKPGVTRKKQMIKISDNFFIYDTPGIMIKKIRSNEQGYILSLLNIIKRENIPVEEVAKWAFNFYQNKYRKEFNNYFAYTGNDFYDFINFLCIKYKFYAKDSKLDNKKAVEFFIDLIKSGKITKVNYEK